MNLSTILLEPQRPTPNPSLKGGGPEGPKGPRAAQPAQKATPAVKAAGSGAKNSMLDPNTGELKAGVDDPGLKL